MSSLFLAFGVILLAELGDKSQLMALAFAARYRPLTVLVAVGLATMLLMACSVLLGSAFAAALPTKALEIVAGIAFLAFAAWTLRECFDEAEEEEQGPATGRWAIPTIAGTFILAEIGDKTMLATIALAAVEEPAWTWLGASAGMFAADAAAIALGALLCKRIPRRTMSRFAVVSFLVFGVALLASAAGLF
jgi:Ca2+/H+ antiporter, TMEM165/GDT1 family